MVSLIYDPSTLETETNKFSLSYIVTEGPGVGRE